MRMENSSKKNIIPKWWGLFMVIYIMVEPVETLTCFFMFQAYKEYGDI